MGDLPLRDRIYVSRAKNLHTPLISKLFHTTEKTYCFSKEQSGLFINIYKKNISVMLLQGLKPAWLDEAYLKSKNSHNVSLVPVQSVV